MANYLIQPAADHTADPNDDTNAVWALGVADPGTISGLTNGTAYVAREFVLSPASAEFTPATVPAAFVIGDWSIATGLTLGGQLDVTITTLPSNGGAAITDIEYELGSAPGTWVSSGGTATFTITGLTAATSYDVKLRAVNSQGPGTASDSKTATSSDAAVSIPSAPFTDTFATLSPDWTKLTVSGENSVLDVSGGFAVASPNTSAVSVVRPINYNADHAVTLVIGDASARIDIIAKHSSPGNEVRLIWFSPLGQFSVKAYVGGAETPIFDTAAGQTLNTGDLLQLIIESDGGFTARNSTNGGVSWTDIHKRNTSAIVSQVPAGTKAGFRISSTASVDTFSVENT